MNVLEVLRRIEEQKLQESQKSELELVDVSTRLKLWNALSNAGIDWSDWGKLGTTKPLRTLWKEIKKGESVLFRKPDGRLLRVVKKAAIDVTYKSPSGQSFRLFEEFYENGNWRRREIKEKTLKRGVQEKILPGETPEEAAVRGLEEEIGINGLTLSETEKLLQVHQGIIVEERKSRGYPGLLTKYQFSDFTFELPERFYNSDGYFVKEEGFNTRLVWEQIKSI